MRNPSLAARGVDANQSDNRVKSKVRRANIDRLAAARRANRTSVQRRIGWSRSVDVHRGRAGRAGDRRQELVRRVFAGGRSCGHVHSVIVGRCYTTLANRLDRVDLVWSCTVESDIRRPGGG
jgi:hypothetical protein